MRETSSPHKPDQEGDAGRLSDELKWVKFSSISWVGDEGLLYARYPDANNHDPDKAGKDQNVDQALYYHKLGTPQADDLFIIRGEDKRPSQHMFGFDVSDECAWVSRHS